MRLFFALTVVLLMTSCGVQINQDLKGFENLQGSWKAVSGTQTFFETWQLEKGRLLGKGILIDGKDTLFGEKLIAEEVYGKLVYIADVENQSPVMFTCVDTKAGYWKFENTEHDFPSIIIYTLNKNNLNVILQGQKDNKTVTEKLDFIKE